MSTTEGISSDDDLPFTSAVQQIIAHQEECTARLQEQISMLIVKQEHVHHSMLQKHHEHGYHQLGAAASHAVVPSMNGPRRTQHVPNFHDHDTMLDHIHIHAEAKAPESKRASSELESKDVKPPICSMAVAVVPAPDDGPGKNHSHDMVHLQPPSAAEHHTSTASTSSTTRASMARRSIMPLAVPPKRQSLHLEKTKSNVLKPRSSQVETAEEMKHIQMKHLQRFTQAQKPTTGPSQRNLRVKGLSRIDKFISSAYFDHLCAVMLITNSLFTGLQVDYSANALSLDLPVPYVVIDYIYGIFFLIELICRCKVAGLGFFTNADERSWNVFDCLVVGMSSLDLSLALFGSSGPVKNLSVVRTVRIVRIARIARIIRLLRFFRALRILLAAIFSTLKSCIWTAMLLGMILYVFGIIFVQGVTELQIEAEESSVDVDQSLVVYFGNLPRGIFTMFKSVLGGIDWEVVVLPLSDAGAIYVILFVIMITFIFLAVTNVISGLFLQSAIESAHSDREDVIRQQLLDKEVYVSKLLSLFGELDDNSDGHISLAEFEEHLNDVRILGFLNALDIDLTDAWTLFVLLDVDQGGTVSIDEFIEGCLRIKGNAKSLHIAQVLYESKWLMDCLHELSSFVDVQFELVQEQLESLKTNRPLSLCPKSTPKLSTPGYEPPLLTHQDHSSKVAPSSHLAAQSTGTANQVSQDGHTAQAEIFSVVSTAIHLPHTPNTDEVRAGPNNVNAADAINVTEMH